GDWRKLGKAHNTQLCDYALEITYEPTSNRLLLVK
ncbi:MAG: hypothetical protein ACJA1X_000345, partial [Bermanella sp.]